MLVILIHIFEYLSLSDRKNVRLVCQIWNECCSSSSFTRDEKFVFRPTCDVSDIERILLNSNSVCVNLEFQGVNTETITASPWRCCSPNVHSIHFYRCFPDHETLKSMILNCVNLTSINVEFDQANESAHSHTLHRVLLDLLTDGVERPKLHTLSLYFNVYCSRGIFLSSIFAVFPCIKHFTANVWHSESKREFSTLLESLNIEINCRYDRYPEPILPIQETRLKKIEVTTNSKSGYLLYKLFFKLKNLEKINLSLHENSSDSIKNLFFFVLENCQNLKEFGFDFHFTFSKSQLVSNQVTRFLTLMSNLRRLELIGFFETELLPPLISTNSVLNVLSLHRVSESEPFCIDLLEHCPNVRHLKLSEPTDRILQEIFENKTELQTLVLKCTEKCTRYGFTGERARGHRGFSIKRLQKLEHFELCWYDYHFSGLATKIPDFKSKLADILREFEFPRLKYLKLDCNVNIKVSHAALCKSMSQMPLLETLALSRDLIGLERTIELCQHLKNLNHLSVIYAWCKIEIYPLEPLFEACPILKYISGKNKLISFDRSTGEVLYTHSRKFKFPEKWEKFYQSL